MSEFAVENDYCFCSSEVLMKVAIQPLHSAQPIDAVKQQLNNLLFKFNESLGGVPLSYSELNFPKGKEYARIMADQFWLHVDVVTKFTIFKPVVGQVLRGKVNKVSDNHVSILILALFNASISEAELSKKYSYISSTKSWMGDEVELKEGDSVDFSIASFQHANGVIHIEGALLE